MNIFSLLCFVRDWFDEWLGFLTEHGDECGGDLAHVSQYGEGEWDPDDGEQDAEHPTANRHRGDVAVTCNGRDRKYRSRRQFEAQRGVTIILTV